MELRQTAWPWSSPSCRDVPMISVWLSCSSPAMTGAVQLSAENKSSAMTGKAPSGQTTMSGARPPEGDGARLIET